MSDLPPINSKFGLDSTDFKAQLTEINRSIRVVESGFRASTAAMGDWSKSATGLESRMKALTEEIDLQQEKVESVRGEYERVRREKGENSRAAQELQIKLNKENETLGRMQGELKQSKDELEKLGKGKDKAAKSSLSLTDALKGLTGNLKTSTNRVADMVKHLGKLATTMAVGVVAGAKAAGVAIAGTIKHMAKLAATLAVGIVAGAAAAGAAIVAMLAKTIGPASSLNETISKVGVVFGDQAEKVLEFGKNAAISLGMSSNAALTAAGTYGNLFRSMGMAEETSADMSIGLVTLAGDLASFNNMDPTDVLEKLRAGLVGEAEPLKALGVNINEALLKEKALEMGLSNGRDALDANAKAQAAYALIMEQTTLAQGDFERTSDGLANQQRILAAQTENLKAKIGTALLPVLSFGAKMLNEFLASPKVQAGLDKLTSGLSTLSSLLVNAFKTDNPLLTLGFSLENLGKKSGFLGILGDKLVKLALLLPDLKEGLKTGGIGGLFAALIPPGGLTGMLGGLGETIGKLLSKILTGLVSKPAQIMQIGLDIIQGLGDGLLAAIPALAPVILQLINSLVAVITQTLPTLLEMGLTVIMQIGMGIMQAIPTLMPVVMQMLYSLTQFLIENLPILITAAVEMLMTLTQGIVKALPKLVPAVVKILQSFLKVLVQNLPMLITAAVMLLTTLVKGIVYALPNLIPAVIQIIQTIITSLLENLPLLITPALQMLVALANGITQALPTLIPAVVQILNSFIQFLVQNLPMLITAAVEMLVALANGIAQALPTLIPAVVQIIPTVITTLLENLPLLITAAIELIMALTTGLIAALPVLIEAAPAIVTSLIDVVTENLPLIIAMAMTLIMTLASAIITNLPEIGRAAVSIITKLLDGIVALLPTIATGAVNIITTMVTAIQNVIPTIIQVGKDVINGLWEGIKAAWDALLKEIEKLFDSLSGAAKKLLGISSPSKVFAEIGTNTALGFGQGFTRSFSDIQRQVNEAISGLGASASVSVTGGFGGRMQPAAAPITVNIQGGTGNEMDMRRLARYVATEIQRSQR